MPVGDQTRNEIPECVVVINDLWRHRYDAPKLWCKLWPWRLEVQRWSVERLHVWGLSSLNRKTPKNFDSCFGRGAPKSGAFIRVTNAWTLPAPKDEAAELRASEGILVQRGCTATWSTCPCGRCWTHRNSNNDAETRRAGSAVFIPVARQYSVSLGTCSRPAALHVLPQRLKSPKCSSSK